MISTHQDLRGSAGTGLGKPRWNVNKSKRGYIKKKSNRTTV